MRVKLSVLDRFIAARVEKHWRLFLAMSAADAAKILEVSEDASPEELKKAYKRKVIENHPDRGGSNEKMVEVNVAMEVLEGRRRPSFDQPSSDPFWRQQQSERPKPKPVRTSFADAKSGVGIPSGVEWKLRANTAFGGYGDKSYAAVVVYGQTASQHIFVGIHHYTSINAFTGEDVDVWTMYSREYRLENTISLDKLAPKAFKELYSSFEGLNKGYNGKVSFLPDGFVLNEGVMFKHGQEMALKDALVELGVTEQDADRKLSVVMRLSSSGTSFPKKEVITLIINGREYALKDESIEFIQRKTKIVSAVFGNYYYYSGEKKDITKSKNGASVLKYLSEKLVLESQDLRDLLLKASIQVSKK
jgi:curved DNA-binding protein CbpA